MTNVTALLCNLGQFDRLGPRNDQATLRSARSERRAAVVRTPVIADRSDLQSSLEIAPRRGSGSPLTRSTSRRVTTKRVYEITQPELDPRKRNELINLTYYDMAEELAQVLGTHDANWCTFAMWPSFTVGAQFRPPGSAVARRAAKSVGRVARIATPEPVDRCVRRVASPVSTWLARAFLRFRGVGSRVLGRSLAFANRGVFYEVGTALADFVETFHGSPRNKVDATAAFDDLKYRVSQMPNPPGDQWVPVPKTLLCEGLAAYFAAMLERDPATKSELVLAGTIRITDYEQQRIQAWLRLSLLSPLVTLRFWLRRFRGGPRSRVPSVQASVKLVDRVIARLVTRFLVVLSTPAETISVHRDLRAPRGNGFFPDVFRSPRTPTLGTLLASYEDPGRPPRVAGEHTGVRDWTDHSARMLFIATYFRSRAQEPALWAQPYSPEDIATIVNYVVDPAPPDRRPIRRPRGYSDSDLEAWRRRGDPDADSVIRNAIATTRLGDALDVRRQMHAVLRHADTDNFIQAAPDRPNWIDEAALGRAQQLYAAWQFQFAMGLLYASLPNCYAGAKGVRVLNLLSDLADDPVGRVMETAQLVDDVMKNPYWEPGPSAENLRRLRLLHAVVRYLICDEWAGVTVGPGGQPNARVWDMTWGLPVNQEDLVGTLFEFSVTPLRFLEEIGVPITKAERNAYVHAWCVAGAMLGVEEKLLLDERGTPLDYEAAAVRLEVIRHRQQQASWEGRRMTAALLEDLEWRMPLFAGLPRAMLRIGVGDDVADILGVPRRGYVEPAVERVHGFLRRYQCRWPVRVVYRRTAKWLGQRLATSIEQDRCVNIPVFRPEEAANF
jgi:ER-bound oxygenase mpaB/B'/Rubber oxygenase, catalytic domain